MKKVCFIGNSHIGAIKEGYDALRSEGALAAIEATFFGSHQNSLKSCRVRDGVIITRQEKVKQNFQWTSGGLSEVVLSDFDELIMVVGSSFRSLEPFAAISGVSNFHDIPPVSSDLMTQIVTNNFNSWFFNLARAISDAKAGVKVTHLGIPFTSDASPTSRAILDGVRGAQGPFAGRLDRLRGQLGAIVEQHKPEGIALCGPPDSVLEETGVFTQHGFCVGSKRLTQDGGETHPETDFSHMNERYGKVVLQDLFAQN